MHEDNCIFCKLANGQIPTDMVYENEWVACFRDTNPQTQTHVLLMPKNHYADIRELASTEAGRADWAHILEAVPVIADILGVEDFRVINNRGKGAGQSVFHVHFHILSDPAKLREHLI